MKTKYKKWNFQVQKRARQHNVSIDQLMNQTMANVFKEYQAEAKEEAFSGSGKTTALEAFKTVQILGNELRTEYHVLNGGVHLFLDDELKSFLIDSAPEECYMSAMEHILDQGKSSLNGNVGSMIVHTATEAIMFIYDLEEDTLGMFWYTPEGNRMVYVFGDVSGKFNLQTVLNNKDLMTDIFIDSGLPHFKMLMGLSALLSVYPDCVTDGYPEDGKQYNHFRKLNNKHINPPDDLRVKHSTSPHFRNGHWRLLKSRRFTKKQGQMVFVKGCFVKGTAEHMEDSVVTA